MKASYFVAVVNLAAAMGVGAGYLYWGRQAARIAGELERARQAAPRPVKEWRDVAGVVRGLMPELGVVVLSHGDVPGYMRPMTMGFQAESPQVYEGFQVGDAVRFTLRGTPPRVRIASMQKIAP